MMKALAIIALLLEEWNKFICEKDSGKFTIRGYCSSIRIDELEARIAQLENATSK